MEKILGGFVGINFLPTHFIDSLQRPTIIWAFGMTRTRKISKLYACNLLAKLGVRWLLTCVRYRSLQINWSNPAHPTKVVVSHATFSWWISQCKKSNKLIHYFQIYSWLKNPAIWLGGSNLANNLWTRNFRDMGFAQENR